MALLIRLVLLALVIVPLVLISKSQGQTSVAGTVRAAKAGYGSYYLGYVAIAIGMLVLEYVFVDWW